MLNLMQGQAPHRPFLCFIAGRDDSGLVRCAIRMNLKQLQNRWDALARKDAYWAVLTEPQKEGGNWSKEEFVRTGELDVARVLDRLSTVNCTPAFGAALDFGCGVGRLTSALSGRFERVDGIDISPEMIERARALRAWPESVKFLQCADPTVSILASNQYDFVLSLIALQHIPEGSALHYVESICRVLNPGGVAYLQMATFLATDSRATLEKLARDESWINRVYRRVRERVRPKKDLMNTYYCRLSETMAVLERCRMRFIAALPEDVMGEGFASHALVFQKPVVQDGRES